MFGPVKVWLIFFLSPHVFRRGSVVRALGGEERTGHFYHAVEAFLKNPFLTFQVRRIYFSG